MKIIFVITKARNTTHTLLQTTITFIIHNSKTKKSLLPTGTTKNRVTVPVYQQTQQNYSVIFTTFVNNTVFLNSIRTLRKSSKTYFGCLLDYAIPNLIRE